MPQDLKHSYAYHHYGTSELNAVNGTYHISKTRKPIGEGSTALDDDSTEQLYENTYSNDSAISQPSRLKVTNHHILGVLSNHQRFNFIISEKTIASSLRDTQVDPNKEIPSICIFGHYSHSKWWTRQWKNNDYNSIIKNYDSGSDYIKGNAKGYQPNNILLVFYENRLYVNFSGNATDHRDTETQKALANQNPHDDDFTNETPYVRARPLNCQQVFTKNK